MAKVSLSNIIDEVIAEAKNETDVKGCSLMYDSDARKLRYYFDDFLKVICANKDNMKDEKGSFAFEKTEVPIIKTIIRLLYNKDNEFFNFIRKHKNNSGNISPETIHSFVQMTIDEIDKNEDMSEEELQSIACFMLKVFNYYPLNLISACHSLLDFIRNKIQTLLEHEQIECLLYIKHIIQKEAEYQLFKTANDAKLLAEMIEFSKECEEDDIGVQSYEGFDEEIRYEYMKRDADVLRVIQEDVYLREYIEKSLNKKAEEIFNYAYMNNNDNSTP